MNQVLVLLLMVLVASIWTALGLRAQRKARRYLEERSCAGIRWRRRFPAASKGEIRRFLELVVDDLILPKRLTLKLRPDDAVMLLYEAVNPPFWTLCDSLEIETLEGDLGREFGLKTDGVDYGRVRLGEIFELIQRGGRDGGRRRGLR